MQHLIRVLCLSSCAAIITLPSTASLPNYANVTARLKRTSQTMVQYSKKYPATTIVVCAGAAYAGWGIAKTVRTRIKSYAARKEIRNLFPNEPAQIKRYSSVIGDIVQQDPDLAEIIRNNRKDAYEVLRQEPGNIGGITIQSPAQNLAELVGQVKGECLVCSEVLRAGDSISSCLECNTIWHSQCHGASCPGCRHKEYIRGITAQKCQRCFKTSECAECIDCSNPVFEEHHDTLRQLTSRLQNSRDDIASQTLRTGIRNNRARGLQLLKQAAEQGVNNISLSDSALQEVVNRGLRRTRAFKPKPFNEFL